MNKEKKKKNGIHSVNLQPNFQNQGGGGAWQDLNFKRGVAGKEGGDFFQGGVAIFTQKIN